ncbi:hypothetical protein [Moorena sp. SIO4A1]|nr:hypothetical protein [Moorena sp. SIO4A1]
MLIQVRRRIWEIKDFDLGIVVSKYFVLVMVSQVCEQSQDY